MARLLHILQYNFKYKIMSVEVLKSSELQDLVDGYKSLSAKRGAMTRELKAHAEYAKDVQWAYDRRGDKIHGWLLGSKIYWRDVETAKTNLSIAEKFRANL